MSHTTTINLIGDQSLYIDGEEMNIYDIESIEIDENLKIVKVNGLDV